MHVGQRIAERYELRREIGRGAMGHVFLAEDTRLRRPVAIKVIAPTQDPVAFQRAYAMFAAEARVSAMMTHSNVVTVYDFIDDVSAPALVMELVEGETMAARLARGERWTIDGAAHLLAQVCEGLAAAHAAGLVHRDLKPANLMLPTSGGVKILDFGIAHSDDGAADAGAILGTPHYMSPEQVRGNGIDARSDLWAIGAIGFEMTTQLRPFTGDNATAVIYEVLNSEPSWERLMPRGTAFEAVLRRALSKDPRARWNSAAELAAALRTSGAIVAAPVASYQPATGPQAVSSGSWAPQSANPAPLPQPVTGPSRNYTPIVAGLVTTIVLAVGISIYFANSVERSGVGGVGGGGGGGGGGGEMMPSVAPQPIAATDSAISPIVDSVPAPPFEAALGNSGGAEESEPAPVVASRESDTRAVSGPTPVQRALDDKIKRSVTRLLDDGAYEDAWEVLATNDGIATADMIIELRQRVRRACNADNADLRSRGQPTVTCP